MFWYPKILILPLGLILSYLDVLKSWFKWTKIKFSELPLLGTNQESGCNIPQARLLSYPGVNFDANQNGQFLENQVQNWRVEILKENEKRVSWSWNFGWIMISYLISQYFTKNQDWKMTHYGENNIFDGKIFVKIMFLLYNGYFQSHVQVLENG